MQKVFKKIFGGLSITWPKLVIFAIVKGQRYQFSVTDDEAVYEFEYYYDDASQSVIIERR